MKDINTPGIYRTVFHLITVAAPTMQKRILRCNANSLHEFSIYTQFLQQGTCLVTSGQHMSYSFSLKDQCSDRGNIAISRYVVAGVRISVCNFASSVKLSTNVVHPFMVPLLIKTYISGCVILS